MLLFIIGPSASGKGTQAELLAKRYNIRHISTGELFRKEIADDTEIGRFIKPIIEAGKFVPGHITFKVLKEVMEDAFKTNGGAILDGFPRLYSQAFEIQPVVDEHEGYFKVIHYTLDFEECIKRQKAREVAGGVRTDDTMLRQRLDAYIEEVDQIKEYYVEKGRFLEINAQPPIEDIFKQTTMLIDNDMKQYGYQE